MNDAKPRTYIVEGAEIPAAALPGGLYVVATPIGNLGDVTLRALGTLAAVELIACEDTRVTRILTGRFGIRTPLLPYHEHNADRQRPKLLALLDAGKSVALVSDAGTPLVSDPGYRLVVAAIEGGHTIIPIPGPSAALAALTVAGLPTDAFLFAGFLPTKSAALRKRLGELARIPATLIFYESPRRLAGTLAAMADLFGGKRPAAVARELTKTFETVRRGTLAALAGQYGEEDAPRGEIVILIGPPFAEARPEADEIDALLTGLLATKSIRVAASEAASATGLSRRELYQRALALKGGGDGGED